MALAVICQGARVTGDSYSQFRAIPFNLTSLVRVLLISTLISLTGFAQNANVPELTIDQAIQFALSNNSSLSSAKLDTSKAQKDLFANRTKRFASFQVIALGSELLTKPSVTFAQGDFGNYPGIGPIPATNQKIEIARKPVGIVAVTVSQPLTAQYRLSMTLRSLALGLESTREDERRKQLDTVDQVRRAYYNVVKAQSKLDSSKASLPFYRESKRLAIENFKHEAILESDLLQTDVQLLQTQNSVSDADDELAQASEKLNDLIGRDIHIAFRVTDLRNTDIDSETQEDLEARALRNRPDLKKAKLQLQQAEYDSRAKKAEYIPEVSLAFDYVTTANFQNALPSNTTLAGLQLTWEPWDWGRRRQELAGKRIQEQQAKVGVSATERSVLLDVSNSWRQLSNSRRQLLLSEASQRTARQKLQETQEKVKREQVLSKELFSAQSDLASADANYQQALTAFWSARADLKKATGEE